MSTNAEVAAQLLRHVAGFLREVGQQNPEIAESMSSNAETYDQVADLVEQNPQGSTEDA